MEFLRELFDIGWIHGSARANTTQMFHLLPWATHVVCGVAAVFGGVPNATYMYLTYGLRQSKRLPWIMSATIRTDQKAPKFWK